MNQFQRSENIIYDEGLEPAAYHEGFFLQPAGTGALPSGDHDLETVPSKNPYQTQHTQVLYGKEEKEVYHIIANSTETDGVLPSNLKPRPRSKRRWWWMTATFAVIVIAGIILEIEKACGTREGRS